MVLFAFLRRSCPLIQQNSWNKKLCRGPLRHGPEIKAAKLFIFFHLNSFAIQALLAWNCADEVSLKLVVVLLSLPP